jgi:hypothetical protein
MPIVRLGQSLCERVEVTKNGGFHSDPIAADGFWGRFVHRYESGSELANIFYQTVTILRGILSYLRQQQAPSKFGAAQTDIAPSSSGTRPFGVMLSTTRRRCWLNCDRKWWAPYRTGGTWSLHLILAENRLQLPCETA